MEWTTVYLIDFERTVCIVTSSVCLFVYLLYFHNQKQTQNSTIDLVYLVGKKTQKCHTCNKVLNKYIKTKQKKLCIWSASNPKVRLHPQYLTDIDDPILFVTNLGLKNCRWPGCNLKIVYPIVKVTPGNDFWGPN